MAQCSRQCCVPPHLPLAANAAANTSVAVFGSQARGDADLLSDRDMLVVSSRLDRARGARSAAFVNGWNTTLYTWNELDRAVARNSLFVQHLKREAVIVNDPDSRLQHCLSNAAPRPSYSWEMAEARELIGALEHVPTAPWAPGWGLDVLATGFRSLAIAELADRGIFAYSMASILDNLCYCGLVHAEDAPLLSTLRFWKQSFRSGRPVRPRRRDFLDLASLVDRRFRLGLHVRFVPDAEFVERTTSTVRNDPHWYRASRKSEAALLLTGSPNHASVLAHLQKPQQYGCAAVAEFGYCARDLLRLVA
jgi:hypothetical protein